MSRGDQQKSRRTEPSAGPFGHVDDWEGLAVDFIDGRLDPQTAAAVEAHLNKCPECAGRLRTQQAMISLLRDIPLEAPPYRLEDRVLDKVLAPAESVRRADRDRIQEPSRWSLIWRRKVRPWVPATIGVAAVFLAIVGYGLLRPNADEDLARYEATTTVAYSAAQTATDSRGVQATASAPAAESVTTAAPMTTMAAEATATTTTAGMVGAPPEETAVVTMAAAGTQDRKAMIANLEEAETPAYFVFDATVSGDGDPAKKATASVVEQIAALTGLEPLEDEFALDGPTFAAFVPRDDAVQLVDLLQAISASVQLPVSLEMRPPDAAAQTAARLLERKDALPELSARRTQPAVAGWTFTTSTLARAADGAGGTTPTPPDEAGTHVLVVIYLRD